MMMTSILRRLTAAGILCTAITGPARGDPAPFDLEGPTLDVSVTRGKETLPVTEVPSLAVGDVLKIRAALPASQSAHYVMVAAFLRGPTNPPPEAWFHRCDTWKRACLDAGLSLTVPPDAQQLLVFFAPETGGDFRTLVGAVRGKPGAFVRASEELNQAALDRMRLDRYLADVRTLEASDPAKLKDTAPLLARSLGIKVNEKCLAMKASLQAACLTEGRDSLILSDGHDASMVATLTSGPASDLALQVGNTPAASSTYSAYIGSVIDFARLMDSFRTAKYQYIPALAVRRGSAVVLMLNTPPSFHDPQSVLVASLPAVEAAVPPALHAVDPHKVYCAAQKPLVLPVEGAPLAFASAFAHRLVLGLAGTPGVELPAVPDPVRGGLVVDTANLPAGATPAPRHAALKGRWGFDAYDGPGFDLAGPSAAAWKLTEGEAASLIAGREDAVRLEGGDATCLSDVLLEVPGRPAVSVPWKAADPGKLEIKLPLANVAAGPLALRFPQHGRPDGDRLDLVAYADAGRLDAFVLHAGDAQGSLAGGRLDLVESLTLRGVEFRPTAFASSKGHDELKLAAVDAERAMAWHAGDTGRARVALKDGRVLSLDVEIAPPRPSASIVSRSVQRVADASALPIEMSSPDVLPLDGKLSFSLRAQAPATFTRDDRIEVATDDESVSTALTLAAGSLALQSHRIAVASLEPAGALGASAFGPLKYRRVSGGVAGDWQPLVTLVRLPRLGSLSCGAGAACTLAGERLFLIEAVSATPGFETPTLVPEGFTGGELSVAPPGGDRLYVRLRDDPSVVGTLPIRAAPSTDAP